MDMHNRLKSSLKRNQFLWNVLAKLATLYPTRYFKKIPREIIVELTNSCNLRCPVCPTHFAMKRERGFMDFGLFKAIIDEFNSLEIKPRINMAFAGEPLLNKDACKFVEYASINRHKTSISTNATLLTNDLSKALVEAGLSSIYLCLDGITERSHETYRKGSKFGIVKRNIEEFVLVKKSLNKDNPLVSILTLLTSFSENEMDKIIEWAKDIGADKVYFKSLSMGSYTTKQIKDEYSYLLPTKKEFRRKISKVYKTICLIPLNQAVVYWNGNLGLCCVDYDNMIKPFNIKERGFLKTFISDEVIQKRRLGFQKSFGLCKRCSLGNEDFRGIDVNLKERIYENRF